MEAKFFVYLFLLLALIGGGAAIYHTTEIDEANKELISTTNQIGSLENHIQTQGAHLELRREVMALLQAKNILEKEQMALRKEITAYRDGELTARKQFDQAVESIRKESIGLVIQDAILPSGVRLHNARIQSIDGDTTTIIHAEGISKLSPDMLPLELKERFRFGMPLGSTLVQSNVPTNSTPALAPLQMPKKDQAETLKRQLATLKQELPYLERELAKAQLDSSSATSPSQKFYIKNRIDSLNQQIEELKGKVSSAESELLEVASEP